MACAAWLLSRLPQVVRQELAALHCQRPWLTRLFAGWCSFWKFVSNLDRRETRRYLQMFYTLMMRPLIAKVLLLPPHMTSRHYRYHREAICKGPIHRTIHNLKTMGLVLKVSESRLVSDHRLHLSGLHVELNSNIEARQQARLTVS